MDEIGAVIRCEQIASKSTAKALGEPRFAARTIRPLPSA